MAEVESGAREAAPGWRQHAAFWLMLALAAYLAWAGAWWTRVTDGRWQGVLSTVVMAVLLVVAAFGTRKANTGWQLFARIMLLGPLVGSFILRGLPVSITPVVIPFLIGLVVALVLLGTSGLEPDGGPFQPTRFRGLLIFMILVAGVMAYTSLSSIVQAITVKLLYPESPFRWEWEVRRLAYLLVYVVTAFGLYKMRAAALLLPLVLGGYLLINWLVTPVLGLEPGGRIPEHVRQKLIAEHRWDGLRYSSFVLLMVVPFLCALAWLRVQARKRRYSSGQEKSPPKTR